ncbi:MAG: hypothetical protein ABI647_09915 [Gemmatimonadota bacterium]
MRQRPWLALGVAAVLASGCAQTFDATTLGVPVSMAGPAGEAPAGTPFRVTAHSVHGLFGLVSMGRPSLEKKLAGQLVGGKAVANLKITTKMRWSDLLLTGLTLGLVAPKTVVYEGIIVGR